MGTKQRELLLARKDLKGFHNELSDDIIQEFASYYNEKREQGLFPKAVCIEFMEEFGLSKSTYYVYLRNARTRGYIKETYKDTSSAMIQRMIIPVDEKKPWVAPIVADITNEALTSNANADKIMNGGIYVFKKDEDGKSFIYTETMPQGAYHEVLPHECCGTTVKPEPEKTQQISRFKSFLKKLFGK